MSMNTVPLNVILADFRIGLDSDDYISNVSDIQLRNIALRGIRDIGFDIGKKTKSLKLAVNSNDTVTLPDDYVDLIKIGVVGDDGRVYVMNQNKHLNYSHKKVSPASRTTFNSGPLDIKANEIVNIEESKTATETNLSIVDDFYEFIFENYLYEGGVGRLYGLGGGHGIGEYRINLDQNRIEISANSNVSEIVMEYIGDEARSSDPSVHVYAEEALRAYIYYKLVEKKSTVPANEKARARAEYYNERRLANARLSNFTKEEALKTIRKNFKLAPKF
jgi:hypothetical protein